ncbi:NUDIX domain-containing protein [Clavibacter michiganensis]|uniref:NUDIX domain-containing protein n=1 Tax=Clavibacter michiganensis TaxID=28447 RepID=UPI0026DB1970|nr:NUDIX domain-containing protein [Clavibacter michiganensis]MDO4026379.1 NUDIX domain-containing protein [Clavibacter michiganensis]MDO4035843.1 NUDIX domain-containing protein [Clavibacter michiganensis]MDO4046678.1 NUDIX domain-containing protein [Clavibacter michiganensis]MDO4074607.1 NUDIX domain-containing protein [Clavibacter michiganensis]MDO4105693.1 NUDIX domain-containing protein [Clavibacter michiganensis]
MTADRPPELPRGAHRDSGDAWVESPEGQRFWGAFGAAGLLVHDPDRGVLLQHRVAWSHHGGTWGLPGGARHAGESAVDGAAREAAEEAGVPPAGIRPVLATVLDLGFWSYTTVTARTIRPFAPRVADAESIELRWVPVDEVGGLELHPGFGRAWPMLRDELAREVTLVVDTANLLGSRPDGWWRDRAGSTSRLLAGLDALARDGLPAADLGLPGDVRWPEVVAVVEGDARDASLPAEPAAAPASPTLRAPGVAVVAAPADGDGEIVRVVGAAREACHEVVVVTADRGLVSRVEALGARALGPGRIRALLDARADRGAG